MISSGTLNTEDNNWELGQTDWFVGRQLGGCNGFPADGPVMLTLQHGGSNAGRLQYIRLHDWHTATTYRWKYEATKCYPLYFLNISRFTVSVNKVPRRHLPILSRRRSFE